MIKDKEKVKALVNHLISHDARFECVPIHDRSGNVPRSGYEVNITVHDDIRELVETLDTDELNTIELSFDRDYGWRFYERT